MIISVKTYGDDDDHDSKHDEERNCFNWKGGLGDAKQHNHLLNADDPHDDDYVGDLDNHDNQYIIFFPGTSTGRRLSRCQWYRRGGGFLGLPRAIGDDGADGVGDYDVGDLDGGDYKKVVIG